MCDISCQPHFANRHSVWPTRGLVFPIGYRFVLLLMQMAYSMSYISDRLGYLLDNPLRILSSRGTSSTVSSKGLSEFKREYRLNIPISHQVVSQTGSRFAQIHL